MSRSDRVHRPRDLNRRARGDVLPGRSRAPKPATRRGRGDGSGCSCSIRSPRQAPVRGSAQDARAARGGRARRRRRPRVPREPVGAANVDYVTANVASMTGRRRDARRGGRSRRRQARDGSDRRGTAGLHRTCATRRRLATGAIVVLPRRGHRAAFLGLDDQHGLIFSSRRRRRPALDTGIAALEVGSRGLSIGGGPRRSSTSSASSVGLAEVFDHFIVAVLDRLARRRATRPAIAVGGPGHVAAVPGRRQRPPGREARSGLR